MPQSIEIAAFVLGAVLLLLALVSGGFKIFGAEISGTAGKLGRAIAFVLGLTFIGLGMHQTSGPGSAPAFVKPLHENGASPVTSAPTNIAGMWDASDGTIIHVWKTGDSAFEFRSQNPITNIQSQGTVSVEGHRFSSIFRTSNLTTGSGAGTISADGSEMTGTFRDSGVGYYSLTLRRK